MAKTNLFKQFFGSMACLMLVGEAYASIEEGLTPNQRIMYDYVIHTANMTVNTDDVAIAMQDKGFIKENDVTGDLIKDKVPNMVEKDSNTGLISADVIPTITSDKLPNNVVTLNSNNKIDDNKLSQCFQTICYHRSCCWN